MGTVKLRVLKEQDLSTSIRDIYYTPVPCVYWLGSNQSLMARMLLLWITVSACSSSSSQKLTTTRRRSFSSDSAISLKDRFKQSTGGRSPSRQRRKERNNSLSL